MLLSELEERSRHFKLALRAGIPVLLLVFLVFYTLFIQQGVFEATPINIFLVAAIIFTTIYFNYFFMEISVNETLIDTTTKSFNEQAFMKKLKSFKPKTIILLVINNLHSLNKHNSTEKIDLLLYTIIHKLDISFNQYGLQNSLIGRRYGAEFLIAFNRNVDDVEEIFKRFIEENKNINDMDIDYAFSIITNTVENNEHILRQLNNLISTDDKTNNFNIQNAKDVNQIEQDIIVALNNKRFKLGFRPLLNIHSEKVLIYEIIPKFISSNNKEILPRIYLPVINKLSLGTKYDLSLVEYITNILPQIDKNIAFNFNLSPFSLRNKKFQKNLFSLLDMKNIDASRLIIQLYERKAHHDLEGYAQTLTTFRDKNIRICIDNFGSSDTSMEYMKHFKFDMLKFDKKYITNLDNVTNTAILSSFINMARDINILTVAKWVDTEEQKNKLKSLDIDYLQGFGIGNPISEHMLIQRHAKGNE